MVTAFAGLRAPLPMKLLKYAGVSVVTVIVTQGVLLAAQLVAGMSPGPANVVAVSIGAIPSFVLNRRWVWLRTGPSHFWREIVPFWTYALLGLVASTLTVAWAGSQWDSAVVANITNLATFLVMWVAKFVFLDRLLFPEVADEAASLVEGR